MPQNVMVIQNSYVIVRENYQKHLGFIPDHWQQLIDFEEEIEAEEVTVYLVLEK
jgi:hypothetical protein